MRNIRLFGKYNDFLATQEAVSGSGKYVEDIFPGFAYVRERYSAETQDTYAFYNGHESDGYEFGDVIYLGANNKLEKVYWTGYTPSMGEKVGLIVVPTSHAADGNARMIAFDNARVNGETEVIYNDYNWFDAPVSYDGPLCWDIPSRGGSNYIYYVADSQTFPYLSSDECNYYSTITNPLASNERWSTREPEGEGAANAEPVFGGTAQEGYYKDYDKQLCVSPFLEDGTLNPVYVDSAWTYQGVQKLNGFADWDGFANTHAVDPAHEMAVDAVLNFETSGTVSGDWYIGALGEMGYVSSRLWAIEYIMKELSGRTMFVNVAGGCHSTNECEILTSTQKTGSNGSTFVIDAYGYENAVSGKFAPSGCYPTEIPAPDYTTRSLDLTSGVQYFTVRPMAMIKGGEIQRG